MAALPYMQLYIADYLADTMHLSTEEHGAYLLLMFNYWQTGRAIPKNRLAKIARMSNDRWNAVETSLSEFFNDNGTDWVHERIERDLEGVRTSLEQKSAAGKASARARKAKKSTQSERNTNECSTVVNPPLQQDSDGNPTNKDPDTDIKDLNPERETHASVENLVVDNSAQQNFTPIGKFQIRSNWQPGPDFIRLAGLWGINLGDGPGYTAEELQQFRDYWTCEGKAKHQQQWEQTFAQSLRTSRKRQQSPSSRKPAALGISQPDTTIPPGFRG